MNSEERLAKSIDKWNLLKHPFYQAWSAGTLPVEALQVYASEYRVFIDSLPLGWSTLGDVETAEEEREHARLWDEFESALGARRELPQIAQTRALTDTARELFARPELALGALYAFEAQQPATAESKLAGLRAWYDLPTTAEEYFEVHAVNWHESQKILAEIEALSEADQEHAIHACEQMAEALWNGLTGIYQNTCMQP